MSKDMKYEPINLNTLGMILKFVRADLPREEWVRNLMAAKSEFGEDAKAIMQDWSAGASNFSLSGFNATWKSIKPSGGVTIASLVLEAKKNGFKFDPISPEEEKRLYHERKERERQRKIEAETVNAQKQIAYRHAKDSAQQIFGKLAECGISRMNPMEGAHLHPYYFKKGLSEAARNLGKGYLSGNSLALPVYKFNDAGEMEIISLQFIEPDGRKRFLKGGELKGGFLPIRLNSNVIEVIICEGYATGLTIAAFYAPVSEVVCAFNAGNLKVVARILKRRYPMARFIIAADNDRETEVKTGINPGLEKAKAAALAIDGGMFIPEFSDQEQGSDWNDRYLLDCSNVDRGGIR